VDIGPEVSFEAAAMIEPLAVALRGWRLAEAQQGDRVAIIGAGTIGLLTLAVAVIEGHAPTVVDTSSTRVHVAEEQGAGKVATKLESEFDIVIDAVGAAATHRSSIEQLARQGRAVWIGNASADSAFDARELVRREQVVRGSFAYSRNDFREAAKIAARLSIDWNVCYPLSRALDVFDSLSRGAELPIKAQFSPAC
jgi:alcohol dehydrogenase